MLTYPQVALDREDLQHARNIAGIPSRAQELPEGASVSVELELHPRSVDEQAVPSGHHRPVATARRTLDVAQERAHERLICRTHTAAREVKQAHGGMPHLCRRPAHRSGS